MQRARRGGVGTSNCNRWKERCTHKRRPRAPPRRAFWGNDLEGTNKGTLLAQCPKRRGASGVADFFFSVVGVGEKKGLSSRDSSLDRLANNHTNKPQRKNNHLTTAKDDRG